jgi:hypothetical protein
MTGSFSGKRRRNAFKKRCPFKEKPTAFICTSATLLSSQHNAVGQWPATYISAMIDELPDIFIALSVRFS